MVLFPRKYQLRRFSKPEYVNGYTVIPHRDMTLTMDVQTTEAVNVTTPDGTKSCQKLKVFCDAPILVESQEKEQKADRLFFQEKWFECKSCRLTDNTLLVHYLATFVECLDQDPETEGGEGE